MKPLKKFVNIVYNLIVLYPRDKKRILIAVGPSVTWLRIMNHDNEMVKMFTVDVGTSDVATSNGLLLHNFTGTSNRQCSK